MKKKYICPNILILNDNNEDIIATSVTATAPDCPWDNEDGEELGNETKLIKFEFNNIHNDNY